MPSHPSELRARAAQACVDRFAARSLAWGRVDCAQIAAHHLRCLGIKTAPLKGVKYRTEAQAHAALLASGFTGLGEALDAIPHLQRIPWALRVVGDLVGFKAEGGLWDLSLTVLITPQKVLGIHTDGQVATLTPRAEGIAAVWRATPCRR